MRAVWVDFNDIEDGVTVTLREFFQEGTPYRGEIVFAIDGDGDSCPASILEADELTVRLLLDLPRFQHGEVKR